MANPILNVIIFAYETALQSDNILHNGVDLQNILPSPLRSILFGLIRVVIPKVNFVLILVCGLETSHLLEVSSRYLFDSKHHMLASSSLSQFDQERGNIIVIY